MSEGFQNLWARERRGEQKERRRGRGEGGKWGEKRKKNDLELGDFSFHHVFSPFPNFERDLKYSNRKDLRAGSVDWLLVDV